MKKQKLTKKLKYNKDGGTALNILVLALIILVSYQFIAPYIGLMSFTDYISKYDNPEVITIDYELRNPVSKQSITASASFIFGEQEDVEIPNANEPISRYLIAEYDVFPAMAILTNAGYSLTEPYYFRVFQTDITYSYLSSNNVGNSLVIDSSTVLSAEYALNHIGDIGKDEFVVDLTNLRQDTYTPSVQSNLVEIYFFNYYGEIMFYDRMIITKEYNWF